MKTYRLDNKAIKLRRCMNCVYQSSCKKSSCVFDMCKDHLFAKVPYEKAILQEYEKREHGN